MVDPKFLEIQAMVDKEEFCEGEETKTTEEKKKKKKKKNKTTTAIVEGSILSTVPEDGETKIGGSKAELKTVSEVIEEKQMEDPEEVGASGAEKKKKKKSNLFTNLEKKLVEGEKEEEIEENNLFPVTYSKKNAKLVRFQDNSYIVNLKNWADGPATQTIPPTRPIDSQFPESHWEIPGVVWEYTKDQSWRNASEEAKKRDLLWGERLHNLRKAAEVHRQVRKHAQTIARPGIKMIDLCHGIEKTLRFILQANNLQGGQAFPTGCSLNHVAAHYTPNYGDNTVLSSLS